MSGAGLSFRTSGLMGLGFTASLAAGFQRRHVCEDMLLWNAEVQYVCRNAARQSYGLQIRSPIATSGLSRAAFNIATNETT